MIENIIIKQLYDISPFYDIPFEYKNVEEIELYTLYRNRLNFVLPEQYEVDETNKRIYFPLRDGYQEPLPEGTKVLVIRRNDITQLEDSTKRPFKSNDIERSLDKLTKICQELSEELGRAIRYNKADDGTSETDAQFYIDYLNAQQKKTEDFAIEAEESARKAALSEQNASDSALSAKESSDTAKASELSAIESANAAREDRILSDQYRQETLENAVLAKGYKEDAELSAEHAATSETNALQYSDEARESASTAMEEADKAMASANAAKLSETNAKTSELNAMASEGNAAQSEENAKDSEVKAEAALEQVLEKASETLVNAQEALRAKDIAVESMGRAVLAETNAKVSEDNSKESETSASESATSAEEYKNRCEEIFQRIGTAIKIKGRVDRLEDLPMVGNLDGDAYLVGAEGLDSYPEYYWYQNHWEFLGTSGGGGTWGTITGDITAQTDLKNALDTKANDSDVVHKAQNETITGVKTFTGGSGSSTTAVSLQTKNALAIGDATQTAYTGIYNHRKCADDGNKVNTAGFLVNKDGTTKFNHKTGTTTAAGTSDDYSIVFGKGKLVYGDGKNGEVYHDIFKDDTNYSKLETNNKQIIGAINELKGKVEEIELFKFPNAIIAGEPNIDHGQVSDFSNVDFLQFPFLVDLTNRRFRAEFCFTTGDDVTTQQNILDSEFGLALAIKNGKGLMAIGHNGTSWAGQVVGSINILPRTTYYAKLSWNRMNYQTQLSTNGTDYTVDMNFGSTQSPYPRTMFIGGSPDLFGPGTAHPFKGSINLNKCFLYIEEQLVWQGMDDAGLATRADISLDNLDAAGQAKFDAKQNKLNQGDNIILTPQEDGTVTISATGGGVIPDNVFTTENLKGGEGIEIVQSRNQKIAYNFGTHDNFFQVPINTSTDGLEISFSFETGDTIDSYSYYQYLFGKEFFVTLSFRQGVISADIGDGVNWTSSLNYGRTLIAPKTKYYIKYLLTSSNLQVKLSTNNTDWTTEINVPALPYNWNTVFNFGTLNASYSDLIAFKGKIWISDLIISKNGNVLYNGATDEYTLVGNPSIDIIGGTGEYVINAIGSGFDFEGTLAEYEEAQPTLPEDAKCLITDDVGNIPTEITQEQLNDKADRDLSNCTRPYVIEQYNDGNGNGYRKWNDGSMEQWIFTGYQTNIANWIIPFPSRNYTPTIYSYFANSYANSKVDNPASGGYGNDIAWNFQINTWNETTVSWARYARNGQAGNCILYAKYIKEN